MSFVRTKSVNLSQDFLRDDIDDSEIESLSVHHQSLTDAIETLEVKESIMILSAQASISSNYSYIFNRTQNLELINQVNLTNNVTKLEIALDLLTYTSIKSVFKLQKLSTSFSAYDHDS